MRPAKFEYFASHTVDEALGLLDTYGEDAKVLAGGLSLVPTMKLRLATPKYVIDLTKIPTLSYVVENETGGVSIGALTTYQNLASSRIVQAKCPIFVDVAEVLGGPQVRNRGTLGGNICHADPACDFTPPIRALKADLVLRGQKGERVVKADDFFQDAFTTALAPGELLTEIRIPPMSPRTGQAYLKLTRRSGDFAMVSAAAVLTLDSNDTCRAAGVVLGAVGPIPLRATETEKVLLGQKINEELIIKAAAAATLGANPPSDIHASAKYRIEMIPVMVKRALKQAFERARGAK